MKQTYFLVLLTALLFGGSTQAQNIVITEISYNPPESGADSTEFIEFYNNGTTTADLSGYEITSGVIYTFPSGIMLAPGDYIVVGVDSLAMVNTYGYVGAYEWTSGGLSNGGESIALKDASGNLMDTLRYDDNAPWPDGTSGAPDPDGSGPTIVLCDPNSDNIDGANWTESTSNAGITVNGNVVYGSPGAADAACMTTPTCPSSFSDSGCGSYTVPSGDETYTVSGVYNDTIPGTNGCDSVMTITVTINMPSTGTDVQTACGSYTWIDGMTYTASNNTATSTLMNSVGCDSVVTLDLTIVTVDNSTSTSAFTITANNTNATYQWIDCDNNNSVIAGETSQSYTASSNGNYAVVVTENSCTDTSSCVSITGIGISENNLLSPVNMYPNPTSGRVFINFSDNENVSFQLFDSVGKLILEENQISETTYTLELNQTGIYFIKVSSMGRQAHYKLIKQ